jgi:hypothetical protein
VPGHLRFAGGFAVRPVGRVGHHVDVPDRSLSDCSLEQPKEEQAATAGVTAVEPDDEPVQAGLKAVGSTPTWWVPASQRFSSTNPTLTTRENQHYEGNIGRINFTPTLLAECWKRHLGTWVHSNVTSKSVGACV